MTIDLRNLGDSATEALAELVHDQASQIASNVNNSGEGVEYLLGNGWTSQAIEQATRTEALAELVHDQASQIASNVNNSGEGVEYLLGNGWTSQEIGQAFAEATR